MTQDLFYYESGYIDTSYFVYTADAESSISAQSSMDVTIGVIKESAVTLEVTTSVTATISHIFGSDMFAFAEAALSAQASVIKQSNIAVSSQFDVATDISRIIHVSADDFATTTVLVGNNLRVRYSEAALDAAFSLIADLTMMPGVLVEGSGTWTSAFEIDCKGSKKANIVDADWLSAFDLASSPMLIAGLSSAFDVSVSQNTINSRIRNLDSALSLNAEMSSNLNKIQQGQTSLNASSNLQATISHIEGADLQAFTSATLTASADRTRAVSSSLTAIANSTADFIRTREVSSQLTAIASLSSSAGKLHSVASAVSSNFALTATGLILNKRPRYTTAVNNITTSTTQKKLGSHSLYRPDSTSRLDVYPSKDFQIVSNQDFIIEFFYYPTYDQTTGEKYILNARSSGINWWRFGYTATNGYLFFDYWNGSSTTRMIGPASVSSRLELNRWNYIRVQRSGSSMSLYLDNVFYSGTIDTDTYSGDIVPSPEAPTISIGYYASNVATGYYDEFYFAKGTTTGGQTPGAYQELNTGAESTTQFLFHFNGNYVDDTHGILSGSAAISSTASLSSTANIIKNGQVALSSTFSNLILISKTIQNSADLQSNGFISVAIGRIRPFIDISESQFTLSAQVIKSSIGSAILQSSSSLNCEITKQLGQSVVTVSSNSSLDANAVAIKIGSTQIQAFGSLLSAIGRIRPEIADLTSTSSMSIDARKVVVTHGSFLSTTSLNVEPIKQIGNISISVLSSSSISITAKAIPSASATMDSSSSFAVSETIYRNISSTISSQASITFIPSVVRNVSSTISSQVSIISTITKIKQLGANLPAVGSEIVAINKIGNTLIHLQSNASVIANVKITSGSVATLESNFQETVSGKVTKPFNVSLQSQITLIADGDVGLFGRASMPVISSITIVATKKANALSSLTSTAQIVATTGLIKGISSSQISISTLSISGSRVRKVSSLIQSTSNLEIQGTKAINVSANLLCQGFILNTGKSIRLDESIIYVVPVENRYWTIIREISDWAITKEDRSYIITKE